MFNVRISPDLKEQFEIQAKKEGVSLGNWLKELGRAELKRKGIEPKG
ncbi:putative repressor [Erwinia tracheiphila PSU-1]|nr:putative repressor [Erwinia tracheiphila PSU-1]